jgi:hypothetical protein
MEELEKILTILDGRHSFPAAYRPSHGDIGDEALQGTCDLFRSLMVATIDSVEETTTSPRSLSMKFVSAVKDEAPVPKSYPRLS